MQNDSFDDIRDISKVEKELKDFPSFFITYKHRNEFMDEKEFSMTEANCRMIDLWDSIYEWLYKIKIENVRRSIPFPPSIDKDKERDCLLKTLKTLYRVKYRLNEDDFYIDFSFTHEVFNGFEIEISTRLS